MSDSDAEYQANSTADCVGDYVNGRNPGSADAKLRSWFTIQFQQNIGGYWTKFLQSLSKFEERLDLGDRRQELLERNNIAVDNRLQDVESHLDSELKSVNGGMKKIVTDIGALRKLVDAGHQHIMNLEANLPESVDSLMQRSMLSFKHELLDRIAVIETAVANMQTMLAVERFEKAEQAQLDRRAATSKQQLNMSEREILAEDIKSLVMDSIIEIFRSKEATFQEINYPAMSQFRDRMRFVDVRERDGSASEGTTTSISPKQLDLHADEAFEPQDDDFITPASTSVEAEEHDNGQEICVSDVNRSIPMSGAADLNLAMNNTTLSLTRQLSPDDETATSQHLNDIAPDQRNADDDANSGNGTDYSVDQSQVGGNADSDNGADYSPDQSQDNSTTRHTALSPELETGLRTNIGFDVEIPLLPRLQKYVLDNIPQTFAERLQTIASYLSTVALSISSSPRESEDGIFDASALFPGPITLLRQLNLVFSLNAFMQWLRTHVFECAGHACAYISRDTALDTLIYTPWSLLLFISALMSSAMSTISKNWSLRASSYGIKKCFLFLCLSVPLIFLSYLYYSYIGDIDDYHHDYNGRMLPRYMRRNLGTS